MYASLAYLEKEFDEIYDNGDSSSIEQEQWSSDQSETDDERDKKGDEREKSEGNIVI